MAAIELLISGQVIGVAVHEDAEKPALRYVHLKRSRNELRIVKTGTAADAEELKLACGTRVPVVVVLDSPRCLHRVMNDSGALEELVPKAFPGALLDDLHVSGWTEGSGTGVSVMRRNGSSDIITALRAASFRIISIHVGPWGLLHLRPLLGIANDHGLVAGHVFMFTEDNLTGSAHGTGISTTIRFGTDELPSTHALAMAAAWEYLLPAAQRMDDLDPSCALDLSEETARAWYERGLLALIAVLLLLVGIDQGLRAHVAHISRNSKYSAQEQVALVERVSNLRAQTRAKENLARQLGVMGGERYAIRAQRVLAHVPPEIVLDRVVLDPLKKPLREREAPIADIEHIRIGGTCTDGKALHAWLNELRMTTGIRAVRLERFTNETKGRRSVFEIEVEG